LTVESLIRWLGGILACAALGIVLWGIWRGTQRRAGRTTGRTGAWLRSPWFYLITTMLFLGGCSIGWVPLPLTIAPGTRNWMLIFGSLLYFPGMGFVFWGRLALSNKNFVSTSFGAQLFADHQLVKSGPYAIIRHPMYTGIIVAAAGSLLIYFTWTTLLFTCYAPMILLRARSEEKALAVEFGEQWREYYRRVPALLPRLKRE